MALIPCFAARPSFSNLGVVRIIIHVQVLSRVSENDVRLQHTMKPMSINVAPFNKFKQTFVCVVVLTHREILDSVCLVDLRQFEQHQHLSALHPPVAPFVAPLPARLV